MGVRFRLDSNDRQGSFERIKLRIKIGNNQYELIILSPLFNMALNSFEVYPKNTLYKYKDSLLVSYLYKENEVDAFFFQQKNSPPYRLLEKSDWGFKHEDGMALYQRHKSKQSNSLSI